MKPKGVKHLSRLCANEVYFKPLRKIVRTSAIYWRNPHLSLTATEESPPAHCHSFSCLFLSFLPFAYFTHEWRWRDKKDSSRREECQ